MINTQITMKLLNIWAGVFLSGFIFSGVAAYAQSPRMAVPFAQQKISFVNGVTGLPLGFESGTPRNFQEVVTKAQTAKVTLDGQLFLPMGDGPHSVVILAPGSGGVSAGMLKHAEALSKSGIGAYLFDPFTARGILNTVSDQSQLSMAASAYDVLMATKMLSQHPSVDRSRIGAIGYSRGGIAVLMAVSEQMSRPVLGRETALKAALVGWPWCGIQFRRAATTPTALRFLVGDSDNWVSPAQCQAQANAFQVSNSEVSIRLVKDAGHGFGDGNPEQQIPEAVHALFAPILYLGEKGEMLDIHSGEPISDISISTTKLLMPWLRKGTSAGSKPGQMEDFISDMTAFFDRKL